MCEKCHGALCQDEHPKIVLHVGYECGLCSGKVTEVDCHSPAAREIESFNMALKVFCLSMRRKFVTHLDKGGWQEIGNDYAFKRLLHEAGELSEQLMIPIKSCDTLLKIVDEAADVANFALFLANRAMTEESRERSLRKMSDEAVEKYMLSAGKCYCPLENPIPPEKLCGTCKAKAAKKDTVKLETK
jgi:hypothetical protein